MMQQAQLPLFDVPTLNITRQQKEAMNEVVKNSRLSRDEIVDRMNDIAGRYGIILVKGNGTGLTLDTLEKWINPSEANRQMPMKALPVFCAAVGNTAPIDIMAKSLGCKVIGPEDLRLLSWAKAKIKAKKANRTIRRIEGEIGI